MTCDTCRNVCSNLPQLKEYGKELSHLEAKLEEDFAFLDDDVLPDGLMVSLQYTAIEAQISNRESPPLRPLRPAESCFRPATFHFSITDTFDRYKSMGCRIVGEQMLC